MWEPLIITCLAIIFLTAGFARSAMGFGDAVIAMPLLILLLGTQQATPLFAITGNALTWVIIATDWKIIDLRSVWKMVAGAVPGIILAVWVLQKGEGAIVMFLAILLLVNGIMSFIKTPQIPLKWASPLAWVAGFFSGFSGGSTNLFGPPVAIYGAGMGWSPKVFRATMQSYFLPAGMIVLVGHGMSGLWTTDILLTTLYVLPSSLVGLYFGKKVNDRISKAMFQKVLAILFILMSGLMFYQFFTN